MDLAAWVNGGLGIAMLIFAAGRWRERADLRDWREWRKSVEKDLAGYEKRFHDAGDRTSRLATMVQGLPLRIEERITERLEDYQRKDLCHECQRRLNVLEAWWMKVNHGERR